jgi:hypothetical protein
MPFALRGSFLGSMAGNCELSRRRTVAFSDDPAAGSQLIYGYHLVDFSSFTTMS